MIPAFTLAPEYAAALQNIREWMLRVAQLPATSADLARRMTLSSQDDRGVIMCALALASQNIEEMDAALAAEADEGGLLN
ncbi:hypothetical protein HVIM_02759 [Roseomonas mucosa]|uniref:hypothetical protein n=1 Tax=Roseomonas mucosa TaxID=207340 RepID=UPI0024CA1953|nr:hypothetical protein [Roseomonas mucosa]QDD95635.1 hypothetical protein HVIM_02759 [Roseomonas mucosa]